MLYFNGEICRSFSGISRERISRSPGGRAFRRRATRSRVAFAAVAADAHDARTAAFRRGVATQCDSTVAE